MKVVNGVRCSVTGHPLQLPYIRGGEYTDNDLQTEAQRRPTVRMCAKGDCVRRAAASGGKSYIDLISEARRHQRFS